MITWEQWERWLNEKRYTVLPYIEEYSLSDATISSWEFAWKFRQSAKSFVIESGKTGRYTYLGLEPVSAIWGYGDECTIERNGELEQRQLPPLGAVHQWLKPFRGPKLEDVAFFAGGCVGFWGYDISLQSMPTMPKNNVPIPDYCFMQIDALWIVDHISGKLYCSVQVPLSPSDSIESSAHMRKLYDQAAAKAAQMKTIWDEMINNERLNPRKSLLSEMSTDDLIDQPVEAAWEKSAFIEAVQAVQEAIQAGDVYQVNLSIRHSRPLQSSAEDIYEWLRQVNPSPYMGLFTWDHFQLICGSPELLVKLHNGKLATRPIGGTRPRGRDEEEDRMLAKQLLENEKERAEHVMLVDLLRHDIGRVAQYGTVKVPDLFKVETYSHVMHLVSQVEGQLNERYGVFDTIASLFPGGTITGVPKRRSMELIEQLEPVRRGPYTGSLGWIDYSDNMEFNIIIRTLVLCDGVGYVQAGAGIVMDSDPEEEYVESFNKAKAIWKAIQYSEAVRSASRNEDTDTSRGRLEHDRRN